MLKYHYPHHNDVLSSYLDLRRGGGMENLLKDLVT